MSMLDMNVRPGAAQPTNREAVASATAHMGNNVQLAALRNRRRNHKLRWATSIVVVVALLAAAALYYFMLRPGLMIGKGYQAVFLTNGQVYFGKLQSIDGTYVKMSNVYYIQGKATGADPQAAADTNAVELIKLTSAVHGPKDEVIINNSQISFFENLDDEGQAAKLMASEAAKK